MHFHVQIRNYQVQIPRYTCIPCDCNVSGQKGKKSKIKKSIKVKLLDPSHPVLVRAPGLRSSSVHRHLIVVFAVTFKLQFLLRLSSINLSDVFESKNQNQGPQESMYCFAIHPS